MRVTENTNFDTIRDTIRRSKERMEGLQIQGATTRKLNQPSDDPVGSAKVLELRTDKMNNDQFQLNAKMAETFLRNSDQALSELVELVVRGKEIALNQSSGANSSEETRLGVAEEVNQLFQQAVSTANRRIGDRYLFGGFKTLKPPVDQDGGYHGDHGQMMIEIANDVFISMNVAGDEVFNSHPDSLRSNQIARNDTYSNRTPRDREGEQDLSENVNIFDELQKLRIAVLTGDQAGVQDTLDRFDQIHGRLVANRVKLGTRLQGIQSASQALERHNITNAILSSSLEDADMAQVASDMSKEETILRTTLASSKKLIQPTLLDFLR
jgi:flagellar hook-associated protein 3 FlgL